MKQYLWHPKEEDIDGEIEIFYRETDNFYRET